MKKKTIFLFLALALPVLTFVFLKYFGKNEFNIPVFYQNGITTNCGIVSNKPYVIDDNVFTHLKIENGKIRLLSFDENKDKIELSRVAEEFNKNDFVTFFVQRSDSIDFDEIKNCIFLVAEPNSIVLIDEKNQIRGYYNAITREELDRLVVIPF